MSINTNLLQPSSFRHQTSQSKPLRAFVRGCPRTSAETFKHLREIKAMLNGAIQDEKERVKNDEQNNPY